MKNLVPYWNDPDESNSIVRFWGNVSAGKRSTYLVELFRELVSKDETILEVGCNVGRNLAYLWNDGYKNLSGVEVRKEALDLAKIVFADYPSVRLHQNTLEEASVEPHDVVFTMAVLEHIPDGIEKVSDLAKRMIVTIEDEMTRSPRHFPRNYKKVFVPLGWTQFRLDHSVPGTNGRFKGRIFVR